MPLPDSLDTWTYETVADLTRRGEGEGDRHDFKARLPDPKHLTKLCCAFANSFGGYVVVGVYQREEGWLPEGTLPDPEISKVFADKLRATPSLEWHGPKALLVPATERVLYVFHVPTSPRRPHIPYLSEERVFWKRVHGSCERMTLEEVRAQIMDYEARRQQLRLLVIELLGIKQLLDLGLQARADQVPRTSADTALLDRLLVEVYPLIENHLDLIQHLYSLRSGLRLILIEQNMVLARVTAGPDTRPELVPTFRAFLTNWTGTLNAMIDFVLAALEERFGISNPFALGTTNLLNQDLTPGPE